MPLEAMNESPADAAEALAVESGSSASPPPEPQAPAEPAAPSPEPEGQPEPAKAAEPAKEPTPKPPGFVPNQAIREAREEARLLREEVAALRAGRAPQQEARQEIDPETDPIAALKEVRNFQQRQQQEMQQHHAIQQFEQRVKTHEAEWAASNPEYVDQITYLREFRAGQLEGLGMTPAQIGVQLRQEALQVSDLAFQRGMNPGEMFTIMAQRSGYKPKAAAPPPVVQAPEPSVDIEAKRAESNAALERIARGQRAGRPTAGAGGNAPDAEITLESLSKLNGAAFDAAMDKYGKTLFGG